MPRPHGNERRKHMAKHAKHAKQASDIETEETIIEVEPTDVQPGEPDDALEVIDGPSLAMGQSPDFVAPAADMHKRKSRRMRIALIIVSVVLVALIGALIYFAFTLINEANDVAYQTASRSDAQTESPAALASDAQDASGQDHGDVPALASLLGKTTDDAVAEVGRGATITSEKDITEETGEGDDKKTEVVGTSVTVALADETTDNSGNTPTLYLDCDKDGAITRVGYSTSVSSLNYADMSFADIVQEGHIIENLLTDAGLPTDDGSIEMPAVEEYRTYADDGTTIVQEAYTFSGTSTATDGSEHDWTCRLSYDYSAANVSGNLADTIKLVQLYINA